METGSNKNKHLTLDERLEIQDGLYHSQTFQEIAACIHKDPCTVSKEVRKHLNKQPSSVVHRRKDGELFSPVCEKLKKPPYACNGCERRTSCHMDKYYYNAKLAQNAYQELLHEAREGIPLSKESFYTMDRLLSDGIKHGQHIYHILQVNRLDVSIATVYRHLHKGYLSCSLIDMPRVVKFKARRKRPLEHIPHAIRKNRTYTDFQNFLSEQDLSHWVEMDTVIGSIGGKVIMTFDFTSCNFMFGILLDSKTAASASAGIYYLKGLFSLAGICFGDVFPVILTDNGGEFANVAAFEKNLDGTIESRIFFCNPMMSSEKPHVEKNHTLFRNICPKGTCFDNLTQTNIDMIFSHVNSVARKSLNGRCPYDVFSFTYSNRIAALLGIRRIPDTDVIQSPLLLKQLLHQ